MERRHLRKILHVQWLLVHRALRIGTWLHKMDISSSCAYCHLQAKTQKHCQWDSFESPLIWKI